MTKFIIDTSFFTNSASYSYFGKDSSIAFENFLYTVQETKHAEHQLHQFYMTQDCWNELGNFVKIKQIPKYLFNNICIKNPSLNKINIPATFVLELVGGFRERGDKALLYSSDTIKKAYNTTPEPREKNKPEPFADLIQTHRKTFRKHTREGFLDSVADFQTICLALELNGKLVTSDQGMELYAGKLGVEIVPYAFFKSKAGLTVPPKMPPKVPPSPIMPSRVPPKATKKVVPKKESKKKGTKKLSKKKSVKKPKIFEIQIRKFESDGNPRIEYYNCDKIDHNDLSETLKRHANGFFKDYSDHDWEYHYGSLIGKTRPTDSKPSELRYTIVYTRSHTDHKAFLVSPFEPAVKN